MKINKERRPDTKRRQTFVSTYRMYRNGSPLSRLGGRAMEMIRKSMVKSDEFRAAINNRSFLFRQQVCAGTAIRSGTRRDERESVPSDENAMVVVRRQPQKLATTQDRSRKTAGVTWLSKNSEVIIRVCCCLAGARVLNKNLPFRSMGVVGIAHPNVGVRAEQEVSNKRNSDNRWIMMIQSRRAPSSC